MVNKILVLVTLFSRSHEHFEMANFDENSISALSLGRNDGFS